MVDKVKNYFTSTYQELAKVHWLSRDLLIRHTFVVLVAILVTMAIAGALDYGLMKAVEAIVLSSQ